MPRSQDIMVGPGRGSAAGSIVVLCPGHHQHWIRCVINLLFERFLNPERVSMPDIDVDFCFETTAGSHRLCGAQIRQRPGGADRYLRYAGGQEVLSGMWAVCMDLPYAYVDSIAKMIPNELNITIDKALIDES